MWCRNPAPENWMGQQEEFWLKLDKKFYSVLSPSSSLAFSLSSSILFFLYFFRKKFSLRKTPLASWGLEKLKAVLFPFENNVLQKQSRNSSSSFFSLSCVFDRERRGKSGSKFMVTQMANLFGFSRSSSS